LYVSALAEDLFLEDLFSATFLAVFLAGALSPLIAMVVLFPTVGDFSGGENAA